MHMIFGSSYHVWALFWIISYAVSLAKLSVFNFILEKRYVLIEMLLLLFKNAAHIHFKNHIQVQTSGLQLS